VSLLSLFCSGFSDGGSDPCEDVSSDIDGELNGFYYYTHAFWEKTLLVVFHTLINQ